MIKSLEKFKKFNEISQTLNKKFKKMSELFDEKFIVQIKFLFENFDKISLDDLENKLRYIKSYKQNIEKFECDLKTKNQLISLIDECLFFINDLIMNQIIENI